jgi:hypothetical protein
LSINTDWPSVRDISSATMRDVVSVMPPGAKGTTHVIGRLGNSSAEADMNEAKDTNQIASKT